MFLQVRRIEFSHFLGSFTCAKRRTCTILFSWPLKKLSLFNTTKYESRHYAVFCICTILQGSGRGVWHWNSYSFFFLLFSPYVLKYNALLFGAESVSVFRLLPKHVVTFVLEEVGLKAVTCSALGTWCVVFQHIGGSPKSLSLQISVSSCHFLTLHYRSPQHPIPIYHQPLFRPKACDDDVLLGGTCILQTWHWKVRVSFFAIYIY